jgi:uncharacterized membrane protein
MKLSDVGESRVRGYLFILGRSLRSSLPGDVVADALREVESHIRECVDQAEPTPDERTALERVLAELGPPLRVAQAYAAEITVDEAVSTGRLLPITRAVWQVASSTVKGFFIGLAILTGYLFGAALVLIAALKPIFPDNVGLFVVDGTIQGFGALFPVAPGTEVYGGYWLIPVCLLTGQIILIGTHRGAWRFLSWWRAQRTSWRAEPRI